MITGTVSHKFLDIKEIVAVCGLEVVGFERFTNVHGVTTLDRTAGGMLVFVERYSLELEEFINEKAHRSGLYVLPPDYLERVTVPAIFSAHVRHVYASICIELFDYHQGYWDLAAPFRAKPVIGAGTVIMPGVHIANGAIIGENCRIFPGVYIGPNVRIGNNVLIKSNTIIGQPGFGEYRDPEGRLRHLPHVGSVIIGDDCEFGALNTICSGTIHPTQVGWSVKADDHVHIAHNCIIGNGVQIAAHAELSGSVVVGDDVWLSPNISINNGINIGSGSFVGIGASVTKSVPEHVVVAGNPARKLRDIE